MATNRKKKVVKEGIRPVPGSAKGPVSAQRQKELDQAEKADKQQTGSAPKSGPMNKMKKKGPEPVNASKEYNVDKFQQMLEYLVNEDNEKAEELFHDIVVEKSRQIYEDLLAEELAEDEIEEADEEEVEESDEDEIEEADEEEVEESDEEVDEDFDLDEFDVEEAPMGGDPADDMEMDMDDDDMDMDDDDMDMDADGDEPATQDDIKDLEAELADLKAEFEELMSDMDGDGEDMDMDDEDMDMDDEDMDMEKESDEYEDFEESDDEDFEESDDEEVEESDDEEVEESQPMTAAEQMREYVEKVTAKMGDDGAYAKSPVAGKNDMGGDASNLVQGGEADTKGTTGGLAAPSTKEEDMGNVNVPGGKASKSMKPMPKGHGAEKKGAVDAAPNKKSPMGR